MVLVRFILHFKQRGFSSTMERLAGRSIGGRDGAFAGCVKSRHFTMTSPESRPVNNTLFLGVAAALNGLNTVLWLVFWLELTGRYWQGGLFITGFAIVAALCCYLLYREHRHRARRRLPSL